MEERRERLLHPHRRAAATYVPRHSQQILHRDHLHLLVAGNLRESLQVHLPVARNHADQIPRPVPMKHQRLEHPLDRLPKTLGNMLSRQVVLIKLIRNQSVRNLSPVKQAGRIRLL